MAHTNYPWQRFWYPRSAEFRLSADGFLTDPDGEYGSVLNPDAVSFEKISSVPCLVLLGEPGIGKSTAVQESQATLRFDLGAFQTDNSLTNKVFQNRQVQVWLQNNETLTLSLDSLDEGRLAITNIVKILLRELSDFQENIPRLRLRVACRTADWPLSFEEGLQQLWGEDNVCAYQLAPLRRKDVFIAAQANELDPAAFLQEVVQREAVPFAIKPVTLQFLLNSFKRCQSFPATKVALYVEGCRGLCEETDARKDIGLGGELSADIRLGVASRIAALTIFGGFTAIWKAADRGDVPDGDLPLRRLSGESEPINKTSIVVDEAAVSEVLGTALFSLRGVNRFAFSHYTYGEFLAAHYIVRRNITPVQAMSLLTVPDDKEGRVAPQLHETAAWLASMRLEFFHHLMATDPSVLLLSDVATARHADRAKLVETLLKLYDEERLLDAK